MPTLRIQFPEKDSPSTLMLNSPRITLGRRADNTIQIVDRTISAFHAELIREDDHYRLHDVGSTNGILINGEQVNDFHLREACKISLGTVECEYSPETPQGDAVEPLPTRAEVETIIRENQESKAKIESLQQEIESLRRVSAAGSDEGGADIAKEEMQRVLRERTELQEALQARDRENASLKTELARIKRDRQNLQDALSRANAEIAQLKNTSQTKTPVSVQPIAKQPASGAQASSMAASKPAGVVGLPKPASVAAAESMTTEPASPSVPAAPTPKPMATPRPMARPAVATGGATAAPRAVTQPAVKPATTPRANTGPAGTQKISLPIQETANSSPGNGATARPLPRPGRPLGQVPPVAATASEAPQE